MEKLRNGLWRLNDAAGCTAYLVAGSDRAYMIDTGMGLAPLMPQIRAVTDLPVELLLTHAHPDHFAAAGEFEHVWLCKEDREILAGSEPLCRRFGVPRLIRSVCAFFRMGRYSTPAMCAWRRWRCRAIRRVPAPLACLSGGSCLQAMRSVAAISC